MIITTFTKIISFIIIINIIVVKVKVMVFGL